MMAREKRDLSMSKIWVQSGFWSTCLFLLHPRCLKMNTSCYIFSFLIWATVHRYKVETTKIYITKYRILRLVNILCFCSPTSLIKVIYIISRNRMVEIRPPTDSLSILCLHRGKKPAWLVARRSPVLMQTAEGPQLKLEFVKVGIFALCNWEVCWGDFRHGWI